MERTPAWRFGPWPQVRKRLIAQKRREEREQERARERERERERQIKAREQQAPSPLPADNAHIEPPPEQSAPLTRKRTRKPKPPPFNYTDALHRLITDIVSRVEDLKHIDPTAVLVFASAGTAVAGDRTACHSLIDPTAVPYVTKETRRPDQAGQTYVRRMPEVFIKGKRQAYMLSFPLPSFASLSIRHPIMSHYPDSDPWVAKLHFVMRELYAIDPSGVGRRQLPMVKDGRYAMKLADPVGYQVTLSQLVHAYLRSEPSENVIGFLRCVFKSLKARYGTVAASVFKMYPHYPRGERQYWLDDGPDDPRSLRRWTFTEADLEPQPLPINLYAWHRAHKRSRYLVGQPLSRPRAELEATLKECREELARKDAAVWQLIVLCEQNGLGEEAATWRRLMEEG